MGVNEPHLAIGVFSRASLLSIKMLRAYHEAGILVPASVDPRTGYRAYHPGQLIDASVIRRLRSLAGRLGVTLGGPAGALYPSEIADEEMEIEAYLPLAGGPPADRGPYGPVTLRRLPAVRVVVGVHTGPYDAIDVAYRRLGAWVAEHAVPGTGPVREVYLVKLGPNDRSREVPHRDPVARRRQRGLTCRLESTT